MVRVEPAGTVVLDGFADPVPIASLKGADASRLNAVGKAEFLVTVRNAGEEWVVRRGGVAGYKGVR